MMRDARISDCATFRYTLLRCWDETKPRVLFVMLNPSVADALRDDPTIRRCISFAERLGCGSLEVVNLFAFRATDPKVLIQAGWPVGPQNDAEIIGALGRCKLVLCAWGTKARSHERVGQVLSLIRVFGGHEPMALQLTDDGVPRHPLYLKGDCSPVPLIQAG